MDKRKLAHHPKPIPQAAAICCPGMKPGQQLTDQVAEIHFGGPLSDTYRVEFIPCELSQFCMLSRLAGEGTAGKGRVQVLESRSRIMEKEKVSLEKNPERHLIYYGLT